MTIDQEKLEALKVKKQAEEYNREGLKLHDQEEYEKSIEYFNKSLELANQLETLYLVADDKQSVADELRDNAWNNLAMAYHSLYDYDTSLSYIEKALSIQPNTENEYVNKGNALSGLYRYEEALESYDKALEINPRTGYALYGKGIVNYDMGRYEEALELFLRYDKIALDTDGILYIVKCERNLGNDEKALTYLEDITISNKTDFDLLEEKGELLTALRGYEEAREFYKELLLQYPNDVEVKLILGEFYYNSEKYKEALEYFVELRKENPDTEVIDSWIIYSYEGLKDIEGALVYYEERVAKGTATYELYNAVGNLYVNQYLYMESIPYFEEAIKSAPENKDGYLNIQYALLYGKRYNRCIQYGKLAEDKLDPNYNVYWYIGESYYSLHNYEQAIDYYKKAMELYPEDEYILSNIAYSYLMMEDYENASDFAKQCLELDASNSTALYVQESMEERKEPIGKRIKEFILENYLYLEDEEGLAEKIEELFRKEDMTNKEIAEAVEDMKLKDDQFTFVLYADTYDYVSYIEQIIEYEEEKGQVYLRIPGFYENTDNTVIDILDSIKNPEKKDLIIDLRDNSGGLTDTANNILDVLLPEYVTSTLISRDGYTYNYYSDESRLVFKHIYMLVNENTASAAELLTLGLRTYLNNVTVIGRDTFGKGVGQYVYKDMERKLMIYVVSHYWNVRQQNIMENKIKPDVYLKSDKLKDYLKVIDEIAE
jgi:tetratricopeptide (TPR) repeat protein